MIKLYKNMNRKPMSPAILIALSFFIVILTGTFLLKLPISIPKDQTLTWIDSFFISTSAVCVTGLVPILNIGLNFTPFGKIILALLIQIGGLGFVTLAVYVLTFFNVKIGISERLLIKEALNQNSIAGLIRLVKSIVKTTLTIEFIGFLVNLIVFWGDYPFWSVIGISVFHAISAFNNCGFDILGYTTNLIPYKDNLLLNINTTFLIIFGGLGFIVIHDLLNKRKWSKLTTHSKIVVKMTIILIISGFLMIKIIEQNNITWLQAYFTSVTTRTAGFSTVDFNTFRSASILIVIVLMFLGASPGSTGGGIKTTTVYTIYKTIIGFATGKKTLTYNRKINDDSKLRAFILAFLALTSVLFVSTILLILEENNPNYQASITNILFESTSAFATVGLSMGITPYLFPISKLLLCFMMFFGRLGPLTIFSLWNKNWNKPSDSSVEYLAENIIIG
ncbi:MAG: trkG [Haloplasmataceae bacterium]|nr:trkG [Haloplasmataceae bacterium]